MKEMTWMLSTVFNKPKYCALAAALAATFVLAACSSSTNASTSESDDCPTDSIDVAVSVSQWSSIVEALGGACTKVDTIVSSASGDPHDFEPAPSDAASIEKAKLVVVNGAGYDNWAEKILDSQSNRAVVVDAAKVVGIEGGSHDHGAEGTADKDADGHSDEDHDSHSDEEAHQAKSDHDNPHIWYSPTFVFEVADAITAELKTMSPQASEYFDARAGAWARSMQPYKDKIAQIKDAFSGTPIGASESIFDYMAEATGLDLVTPPGFQIAIADHTDPAPSEVAEFEAQIDNRKIDVLVYNTQTSGSLTSQLRERAEKEGIPAVNVTETPPKDESFADWQLKQLDTLGAALAKGTDQQ